MFLGLDVILHCTCIFRLFKVLKFYYCIFINSITCRDILYFVFWLPYCHTLWLHQYLICIIQKSWISLERDEIWQKGKHHSSSLLKAFQFRLFFNTSVFHFIGTLKKGTSEQSKAPGNESKNLRFFLNNAFRNSSTLVLQAIRMATRLLVVLSCKFGYQGA